jgi:transcriptional regulator with XRE-family HTH domain
MQKSIGRSEQLIIQTLLKTCRLEAGLTQADLAARLDTGPSRISEYEHGERRMDLVQLADYTEALGLPLVRFVERFAAEVRRTKDAERH